MSESVKAASFLGARRRGETEALFNQILAGKTPQKSNNKYLKIIRKFCIQNRVERDRRGRVAEGTNNFAFPPGN